MLGYFCLGPPATPRIATSLVFHIIAILSISLLRHSATNVSPSTRPRPVNSTATCHRIEDLDFFASPDTGCARIPLRRHRTESASPGFKLFFRSFVHLRASGILSEVGSSHPAAEDARHDPPTYTSATWTGTETEAAAARRGRRGTRRGRGSWRGPPGGPA